MFILLGILLLYLAYDINNLIRSVEKNNTIMIVFIVLFLNFLSSTQEIIVDGWALTMLKKKVSNN